MKVFTSFSEETEIAIVDRPQCLSGALWIFLSHTYVYGIEKSLCFLVSGKIDPIAVSMLDKHSYIQDSSLAMLLYMRQLTHDVYVTTFQIIIE